MNTYTPGAKWACIYIGGIFESLLRKSLRVREFHIKRKSLIISVGF